MSTLQIQVKVVTLSTSQVRILTEGMEAIAEAIETGEPIKIRKRKTLSISPARALRNQAGWLRRQLAEQNGAPRTLLAWDYQEER